MPYPSFYGLLLTVAVVPTHFGIAIMALYGAVRAMPALLAAANSHFAGSPDLATLVRLRLFGHVTSGTGCLVLAGGAFALLL
jgi:hypothetical protein